MATCDLQPLSRTLRRLALGRDGGGMSDCQLLTCFVNDRDAVAIEALVRRHGPMVLGVCRRVLGCAHDADDAFQATFLVLVRRAHTLQQRERLAPWLYGVAYRTSLELRRRNARRHRREVPLDSISPITPELDAAQAEVLPLLDQELVRLPEKYRTALLLCDLQNRSRKEASADLAVPEGTLSSRLATARKMLALRLKRRGVCATGAILGLSLPASAAVPPSVISSTVEAAAALAAGSVSSISPQVAALLKGVLITMTFAKVKAALSACLALSAAVILTLALGRQLPASDETALSAVAANAPQAKEKDDKRKEVPQAKEKGDKRKEKVPDMVTLTGKVEKTVMDRKRDDGSVFQLATYTLIENSGNKVQLPAPRRRENGELLDKINIDEYSGKQVVLSGRAFTAKRSERPDAPVQAVKVVEITAIKLAK